MVSVRGTGIDILSKGVAEAMVSIEGVGIGVLSVLFADGVAGGNTSTVNESLTS